MTRWETFGIVWAMAKPRGHRLSAQAWDDLLRAKGVSLTHVAERADIGRASVSGLVHGHARASIPMAHKLAAALDCHPETLFPTLRLDMTEVA